jgi:hypothetical protein
MSDPNDEAAGLHDAFLAEKFAAFQVEYPGHPFLYHRLLLIKALREDLGRSPKESAGAVDAFLRRRGLGVPQPSLWFSAVFALIVGAILLIPVGLAYLLWRLFQGP